MVIVAGQEAVFFCCGTINSKVVMGGQYKSLKKISKACVEELQLVRIPNETLIGPT